MPSIRLVGHGHLNYGGRRVIFPGSERYGTPAGASSSGTTRAAPATAPRAATGCGHAVNGLSQALIGSKCSTKVSSASNGSAPAMAPDGCPKPQRGIVADAPVSAPLLLSPRLQRTPIDALAAASRHPHRISGNLLAEVLGQLGHVPLLDPHHQGGRYRGAPGRN